MHKIALMRRIYAKKVVDERRIYAKKLSEKDLHMLKTHPGKL